MKLVDLKHHSSCETTLDVPDEANAVRIEIARHSWHSEDDYMTWSIEQDGVFRGSSTSRGGQAEEGVSWDETPLMPGTNRKLRVSLRAHGEAVLTEVDLTWL